MSEAELDCDVLGDVVKLFFQLYLLCLDLFFILFNDSLQLGLRLNPSILDIRVSDLVLNAIQETERTV